MKTKTILPLMESTLKGIDIVPHKRFFRNCNIDHEEVMGRKVWSLVPKTPLGKHRIFYLHGGAYVMGFLFTHWRFLSRLAHESGCTVVAPDYPLAPDHHVDDVFNMVLPLYKKQAAEAGAAGITLMGDSAGGGLALALAQALREEGLEQPVRVVLLAPWLDVTMTNPEIAQVDKVDPYLRADGLRDAGLAYAGETDPRNYRVSPIYGSLENLAPLSLYVGTYDILAADCRRLKVKAAAAGAVLDYNEIPGLIHSGVLLPLPEGKAARGKIVEVIRST